MSEFDFKNPIKSGYSNKVRKPSGIDWKIRPSKKGAKLTVGGQWKLGPGTFRAGGTLNPTAKKNKGKFGASWTLKW